MKKIRDQRAGQLCCRQLGSTIEGSSFSGLLTRVDIGHIRIGSAGPFHARFVCVAWRGLMVELTRLSS